MIDFAGESAAGLSFIAQALNSVIRTYNQVKPSDRILPHTFNLIHIYKITQTYNKQKRFRYANQNKDGTKKD